MIITTSDFYKYYQINFFKYQQIINKDALDNIDTWVEKFNDDSKSNDKDHITQIIKSHIRINYFHCIDTLFELIFGLFPRKGKVQEDSLPFTLAKSNDAFNRQRILGLVTKDELILKELLQDISDGKNHMSLLRYIFYYQINQDNVGAPELLKNVEDSISPILELLSIFAKDIADKSEYNSLKHALRIFPFNGIFRVLDPNSNKEIAGIDFKNAHQFMTEKKGEMNIISKNFDTSRDFEYTIIASKMIWNIIKIRDVFFSGNAGYNHCYVYFFDKSDYCEFEKSVTHKQKIEIKIKSI